MSSGWDETISLQADFAAVVCARRGAPPSLKWGDFDIPVTPDFVRAFGVVFLPRDASQPSVGFITTVSGAPKPVVSPTSRVEAVIAAMRAAIRFAEGA